MNLSTQAGIYAHTCCPSFPLTIPDSFVLRLPSLARCWNRKTMDDVRIRTNVGAFITLVSAFFIVLLTIGEFIDYRRVHMKNSLVVDVSRGEKLAVHIDIDFPRVPCYRESSAASFSFCSYCVVDLGYG